MNTLDADPTRATKTKTTTATATATATAGRDEIAADAAMAGTGCVADEHPTGPWALPLDFDEFCRDHHPPVVALGYFLTRDWSAAEDLAQDAFFAAHRSWDRIGRYDDPGAWVRRVVANRAVSWRRRIGSEAKALARLALRRPEPDPTPDPDVGNDEEVWDLVRSLSGRQAQVFALTYAEDLSLDQVAEILEITPGTAKTHLARARAALTIRPEEPT